MPRMTLRLDGVLRDRLVGRAADLGLTPSAFVREVLTRFEGTDPSGHHARFDELQATSLQTLAILASFIAMTEPKALERGMADARAMLRERGLLDPAEGDEERKDLPASASVTTVSFPDLRGSAQS